MDKKTENNHPLKRLMHFAIFSTGLFCLIIGLDKNLFWLGLLGGLTLGCQNGILISNSHFDEK